jgi:outer membrane protein, heavy metal efflux system
MMNIPEVLQNGPGFLTYRPEFPNHNTEMMQSEITFHRTGSHTSSWNWPVLRAAQRMLTSLISRRQRLLLLVLLPLIVAAMGAPRPASDANLITNPYPELDSYLHQLLEQNPELGEYRSRYRSEQQVVRQVGVLPDPELSIAYDLNPMDASSVAGRFSVSAMQMFPWFGTLSSRQDQMRASAEATRHQMNSRQLALWRDLQAVWLELAGIARAVDIAGETLELVGDLERQVQARYEGARAGQADLLRIQMEQERIRTRISTLEDRKKPLIARFNSYLNRDAGDDVSTPSELAVRPLPAEEVALRERMLAVRPEFDELDARRQMIREDEVQARLAGRPEFGLGLEVMGRDFGPMSMNPDMKESFIGMATIRLPIYRSQYRARREQSVRDLESLEFRRESTENRFVTELEEVLEAWRDSERTLRLLQDELIPRAGQALDILREGYAAGTVRFDEVLGMQRELLDLELERVDALVAQNQAAIRLESLITHPTETNTAAGTENHPGLRD